MYFLNQKKKKKANKNELDKKLKSEKKKKSQNLGSHFTKKKAPPGEGWKGREI